MEGGQRPWWLWALAGLGALAALVAIILAVWKLPSLLYGDVSKASADARLQAASGFRTALVAGLAGLAALGSLAMATRTYRLTQQGQITDRYTKAIEQLGSDKLDVRLGGIFALERIADDSTRDRVTVTEVLTAFVRSHAPWPPSQPGQYVENAPIKDIPLLGLRAPDVHAALTVLGRRQPPDASDPIALIILSHSDLRRADLFGAKLERVSLMGVQLEGSVLAGMQLRRALLRNTVLHRARLSHVQLQGAILRDVQLECAILRDVQLQGAILRGVQLEGAILEEVQLEGARCDADTVWPDGFDWRAAGVLLEED
jgi:hypothetical protein